MAPKKAVGTQVEVGNIREVSGEVNIAAGDIYKGYTEVEVTRLLTKITSEFQPRPFDGHCPYKGLDVFEVEDAGLFFGRESLVNDLVQRVKLSRTIFITGPSGSGKSSLARAGLISALKQGAIEDLQSDSWQYAIIKPGRDALESLALAFSRLKSPDLADYFRAHVTDISILNACAESVLGDRQDQRFVLLIDQFEEVFTQITREDARMAFLKVLTDAIAVENGRVTILFAMRSDFVSNCATYPSLNAMLNQPSAFAQIGAMQPEELVSAIAQPALRVGLRIDPDLVTQIINDTEGEPGTLPLMQFALKDLFVTEQAKGGIIAFTRVAYHERGGIHKSLERHADNAFTKLTTHEQTLAQSIFSGLIEVGRGTPDTSRTAPLDELIPENASATEVAEIVQKLADARLITTDERSGRDMVTISHEKLIDAWPWLRKLVNENREVIAVQNEITDDAEEWDQHQRDSSYLYTGARLANAREKLASKKLVLSGLAAEFVRAGSSRQKRSQLLVLVSISTIIALLIGAVIVFGYQSNVNAQLAQQNAEIAGTAQVNAEEARQQAQIAFAQQLASEAKVIQNDKRDLAILMSLEALKIHDDFETRSSLLSSIQCCSDGLVSFMGGHTDSVWAVAFSPDGKTLASAGNDGIIILWDTATHRLLKKLVNQTSSATIYTLAFSPKDKLLAAGDGTGAITLYNTQTWKPLAKPLLGHKSSVLSIKFSIDGSLLVSGSTDGTVIVWNVKGEKIVQQLEGPTSWVWDVAISPDNKTVASVGRYNEDAKKENTLFLWDLSSDSTAPHSVGLPLGVLVSVAFNNDIGYPLMLTGDWNGNVIIWDMGPWLRDHKAPIASPRLKSGIGATTDVWGLKFLPRNDLTFVTGRDIGFLNRNQIVLTSDFSKITLQRESLGMTGNNIGVFRVDVSPDGKFIAAAGQDGLVSFWNASEASSVFRHNAEITNMQLLPTASQTVMSVDTNGWIYWWNYSTRKIFTKLPLDTSPIVQSAILPDGTKVVTGTKDGILAFWESKTRKKLYESNMHSGWITSLAFSPDGNRLASSDENGKVILWNLTSTSIKPSTAFLDKHQSAVQVLLFSPDGKTLVGGGCGYPISFPTPECSQGAIYIWDTVPELKLRDVLPGKAGFVWSMAFNTANHDELAVGSRDGTVTIWNLHDRRPRITFRLGKSDITALAFSPDGKYLAIGADVYKVYLYDAQTGQMYGQSFREHDGAVIALAFTADGDSLLSASSDKTIVIHDLNPVDWQARACQLANRNLTPEEWKTYIGEAWAYQAVCPDLPLESSLAATPTPAP